MTSFRTAAIWLGGAALLAATAIDTIAVLGRQIGAPLRGSIELIQAAVLIAGSIALVLATLVDRHARVKILLDRMGPRLRTGFERTSDLMTAAFLIFVLIGSGWLALDLWNNHETSEIAGVPWLWLRLFANLSLLIVSLIALRRVFVARSA